MKPTDVKLTAALAIGGLALALSIYNALHRPAEAAPGACVDQQARDRTEQLRRVVVDREAAIARLTRAAAATPGPDGPAAAPGAGAPAGSTRHAAAPVESGPRIYAHFEVPNPAVTVTQKSDGTYDIRTTDRKLSGTSMQVTAVTQDGEEETLLIRIP
jgi:hypothetical protein